MREHCHVTWPKLLTQHLVNGPVNYAASVSVTWAFDHRMALAWGVVINVCVAHVATPKGDTDPNDVSRAFNRSHQTRRNGLGV